MRARMSRTGRPIVRKGDKVDQAIDKVELFLWRLTKQLGITLVGSVLKVASDWVFGSLDPETEDILSKTRKGNAEKKDSFYGNERNYPPYNESYGQQQQKSYGNRETFPGF